MVPSPHASHPVCRWPLIAFLALGHILQTLAADSIPLFNGRDLTGWTNVNCAPETWSITNGMIHCTGIPTGALRTTRQYENFILELDWRHLRNGGNSGVFIWAGAISAPGVPFLRAIEVQVLDHGYGQTEYYTTHGDVFPIHGSTMKPHGRSRGMRSFPSENRSKPAPEWNHYRIACTNGVLRLSVNGAEVSGGSDCNYRKGYIALESEGAPVEFKNIRLQELPGSNAPADLAAPPDEGWQALYNGLDLREWAIAPASSTDNQRLGSLPQGFRPADWQLEVLEDAPHASKGIWRRTDSDRFEMILDFQLPKDAPLDKPWLEIQTGVAEAPALLTLGEGQALIPPLTARVNDGQWHRILLRVDRPARTLSLQVDGTLAGSSPHTQDFPNTDWIGLVHHGRAMKLASLYLRAQRP